jgi:hypothetical protein
VVSLRMFIIPKLAFGLILAAVGAGWASLTLAMDLPFGPDFEGAGWSVHTPRGKEAAVLTVERDGSLRIQADQAVSFLYCFLPDSASTANTLSWRWRVDQGFPATDLSQPGARLHPGSKIRLRQ